MITQMTFEFSDALPDGGALIGLDPGTKTIGTAFCDAGWRFASPGKTLPRGKFARDKAALEALIAERSVKGIVIGLPLNMDGTKGIRVERTEAFAEELSKAFPDIPYHFWDERLTTVMAQKQLIAADVSRKKRKKVIDKMAAVAILEGYLQHLSLKNRG